MKTHPTLCGYDAYELGEAIDNMRKSHGVTLETLLHKTGLTAKEYKTLIAGKSYGDNTEGQAQSVSTAIGFATLKSCMEESRTCPRLDKNMVADAVNILIDYECPGNQRAKQQALRRISKDTGISAYRLQQFLQKEETPISLSECFTIATLAFRQKSIGALVVKANNLTPEIDPQMLANAVIFYQDSNHLSIEKVSAALGLSKEYYSNCLAEGKMTKSLQSRLPQALGVRNIQEVINFFCSAPRVNMSPNWLSRHRNVQRAAMEPPVTLESWAITITSEAKRSGEHNK